MSTPETGAVGAGSPTRKRAATRGKGAPTTPPTETSSTAIAVIEPPTRDEAMRDELRLAAAAPVGLEMTEMTARAMRLSAVARTREEHGYRELGYDTWEEYCERLLRRPRRSVEEELASLEALGQEVFAATQIAGLTRAQMRTLRQADGSALPRVLPTGEILIGEVAVSPQDAAGLAAALKDLVGEMQHQRMLAEDAAAAADDARAELEEERAASAELRAKLTERTQLEREGRARALNRRDLLNDLYVVAGDFAALATRVEEERPDAEEVRNVATLVASVNRRLLSYASGWHGLGEEDSDDELDVAGLEAAHRLTAAAEAAVAGAGEVA